MEDINITCDQIALALDYATDKEKREIMILFSDEIKKRPKSFIKNDKKSVQRLAKALAIMACKGNVQARNLLTYMLLKANEENEEGLSQVIAKSACEIVMLAKIEDTEPNHRLESQKTLDMILGVEAGKDVVCEDGENVYSLLKIAMLDDVPDIRELALKNFGACLSSSLSPTDSWVIDRVEELSKNGGGPYVKKAKKAVYEMMAEGNDRIALRLFPERSPQIVINLLKRRQSGDSNLKMGS